jgi:hypothetical protein
MVAVEGHPHGPLAPYGYKVVGKSRDKTYAVDPERAAVVREIFERYVAGYPLGRLARAQPPGPEGRKGRGVVAPPAQDDAR